MVATAYLTLLAFGASPPRGKPTPPLIERRSCLDDPQTTQAFDRSKAGDVVYRFVYDNVFRQDLGRGWALTTKHERSGMTRKEWLTGTIPVVPEPISPACTVGAKYDHGQWMAVIRINGTYYMATVVRQKRWLVDYFLPLPSRFAPQAY